eukprot:jgi/Tetstr1/457437/TSEL_044022.t1
MSPDSTRGPLDVLSFFLLYDLFWKWIWNKWEFSPAPGLRLGYVARLWPWNDDCGDAATLLTPVPPSTLCTTPQQAPGCC